MWIKIGEKKNKICCNKKIYLLLYPIFFLSIGMKHWFMRLILVVFGVLLLGSIARNDLSLCSNTSEEIIISNVVDYDSGDFCINESEWSLPHRCASLANTQRFQNTAKRVTNPQRYNGGLHRVCKDNNFSVLQIIHNSSFISYFVFIKPAHRLISLGKLII